MNCKNDCGCDNGWIHGSRWDDDLQKHVAEDRSCHRCGNTYCDPCSFGVAEYCTKVR